MRQIIRNIYSPSINNSREMVILISASEIFLKYGYHGTTLSLIAREAGVNKTSIHYYFRSKDNLYKKILELIIDLLVKTSFEISSESKGFGRFRWFLMTEQYNNKSHFEKTLREIFATDYEQKLDQINEWLNCPSNINLLRR